MAVTLLSMSGQFTVVSYLAPILREAFAATPRGIALMFGIFGVAGVLGNYLATKAIGRFGVDRAILVSLFFLIAGIGMFGVFFGNYFQACVACAIWGLGTFSSNSLQQSRLVGIAPALAAATVALNTSAVYLGQSVGAAAGGSAIKDGHFGKCRLDGVVFLVLAVVMSVAATSLLYKPYDRPDGMGHIPGPLRPSRYHGGKALAFRQS